MSSYDLNQIHHIKKWRLSAILRVIDLICESVQHLMTHPDTDVIPRVLIHPGLEVFSLVFISHVITR